MQPPNPTYSILYTRTVLQRQPWILSSRPDDTIASKRCSDSASLCSASLPAWMAVPTHHTEHSSCPVPPKEDVDDCSPQGSAPPGRVPHATCTHARHARTTPRLPSFPRSKPHRHRPSSPLPCVRHPLQCADAIRTPAPRAPPLSNTHATPSRLCSPLFSRSLSLFPRSLPLLPPAPCLLTIPAPQAQDAHLQARHARRSSAEAACDVAAGARAAAVGISGAWRTRNRRRVGWVGWCCEFVSCSCSGTLLVLLIICSDVLLYIHVPPLPPRVRKTTLPDRQYLTCPSPFLRPTPPPALARLPRLFAASLSTPMSAPSAAHCPRSPLDAHTAACTQRSVAAQNPRAMHRSRLASLSYPFRTSHLFRLPSTPTPYPCRRLSIQTDIEHRRAARLHCAMRAVRCALAPFWVGEDGDAWS